MNLQTAYSSLKGTISQFVRVRSYGQRTTGERGPAKCAPPHTWGVLTAPFGQDARERAPDPELQAMSKGLDF